MERIDFLGAHSVGKSTLHAELVENRDRDAEWLTRTEAKRKIATDRFVRDGSPRGWVKAASCHLPRFGEVFVEAYTRHPARRAFAEADPGWHEFYEYCLNRVTGGEQAPSPEAPGQPGGRARRESETEPMQCVNLSSLFSRLTETCLLDDLEDPVVFDESLAHSTADLVARMPDETAVRDHFEKMPTPDGVVHLTAPVGEIVDRIRNRSPGRDPVAEYEELDDETLRDRSRRALRVAELGASTLDWKGADVVSVDATAPVEENVRRIEAFLA